jgi:prepilin-type N-terminal cleavage/methylation domain-containing protein/prepilin-type processing-associated H-X9-DG protein
MTRRAFTLVELLVVVAIVAVLAALVFPAFARAKEKAKQTACSANLRQIGVAMAAYRADYDDRIPDRRDVKARQGFRPWTGWPASDPRSGWAVVVLGPYARGPVWSCPSVAGSRMAHLEQVRQDAEGETARYWMWRFDQIEYPVPLDNVWGKLEDQALADLRDSGNRLVGRPESPAEVELAVDPYFPRTINTVEERLRGFAVHFGGRNRLFLDGHVRYLRDIRTSP